MIHRYAVKIGGRERVIELRNGDEGSLEILVDGERRDVAARQVEPGVWSLMVAGEQVVAQVDGGGPKLTLDMGRVGEPVVVGGVGACTLRVMRPLSRLRPLM